MPIRSPRRFYKITQIKTNLDDNLTTMDTAPTETVAGTKRDIVVKMKEAIANFLGLTPLEYNDPIFTGVFDGHGTNKGATFRKNIGGYKDASYTLVARTVFSVTEKFPNPTGSGFLTSSKGFRTMTIGFPKGHSVTEVINWLASTGKLNQIQAIVTPAGKRIDLFSAT